MMCASMSVSEPAFDPSTCFIVSRERKQKARASRKPERNPCAQIPKSSKFDPICWTQRLAFNLQSPVLEKKLSPSSATHSLREP